MLKNLGNFGVNREIIGAFVRAAESGDEFNMTRLHKSTNEPTKVELEVLCKKNPSWPNFKKLG